MRLYLPKEVTIKQVFVVYWQNFTTEMLAMHTLQMFNIYNKRSINFFPLVILYVVFSCVFAAFPARKNFLKTALSAHGKSNYHIILSSLANRMRIEDDNESNRSATSRLSLEMGWFVCTHEK